MSLRSTEDRDEAPLPRDLRSLLIVCPSWVGDTVMATPVLRAARGLRPEARIVAAMRPGLDTLLAGAPWLDEMIPLTMKGLLGPGRAARLLARTGAEAIVLLPNSFRTGLTARLTGIPRRIGYDRDGRGRLLTHGLAVERSSAPTPAIDYYARLGAYALGADVTDRRVELFTTPEDEEAADRLLAGVSGPFVLLNPGANNPSKRWPAERFAAVADELHERRGLAVVITGAPAEGELTASVARSARVAAADLAEQGVTLGALKAIAARAAVLVTNDTGPRHIAAAVGTPVVCLFGPTDHRWTTLPGVRERRLLAEPFLPAELVADRHDKLCGIARIPVSDVVFCAERLLAESTEASTAR